MNPITVKKDNLIATVRENREAHRDIFLRAQEQYRRKMVEELDRALQEARDGGTIRRAFSLPVPEDHTDDFDTAIDMLEWSIEDTVELDEYTFARLVRNEWGWQQSFTANTEAYTSGKWSS